MLRATLSSLLIAATLSATAVRAMVGRYPCGTVDGGGNLAPDQAVCDNLLSGPVGGECVLYAGTSEYFCGAPGAACATAADCDAGSCDLTANTCIGDIGSPCASLDDDDQCFGNVQCGADLTCGGTSAGCGIVCEYDPAFTGDLQCSTAVEGDLCASEVCQDVSGTGTLGCAAVVVPPSQRARRQRRKLENLCPLGMGACAVDKFGGYECLNFDSSLENCGGCSGTGEGQDCSTMEGAFGIECISGQCIATSCEPGYALDPRGACAQAW